MRSEQFVVPYGDHAETNVFFGEYHSLLEDAVSWSRYFGEGLIHNLYGGPYRGVETELTDVDLKEYGVWAQLHSSSIDNALLTGCGVSHDADRALHFQNFHVLNQAMLGMWYPIVHGEWNSESGRLNAIRASQDNLALEGLRFFESKLEVIRTLNEKGEDYFTSDNPVTDGIHRYLEGRLNEIDTAMELLEIAKRVPGSFVVPAPMQFEHGATAKNADFIFFDGQGNVKGVQAKTLTKERYEHDVDGYDHRYVVVADGSVDLGNVRAIRTARPNSDGSKNYSSRQVSWNGLVSAHYILDAVYGPLGSRPDEMMSVLCEAAPRARDVVGNIKSMNEHGARTIGSRVLHGMGYDHDQVQELLYAA